MSLLLDERAVVVQPSLVRRLGIIEAALVQQLHYWAQRATRLHDGHSWVYKTYQDWSEEIGVSAKAARGALDRLRRDGIVVAIQNPADPRDRTLWWRIDHAVLEPSGPSAPQGSSTASEGGPAATEGSSRAPVPSPASQAQTETGRPEKTSEIARARKPVTYQGKSVPAEVVDGAERALQVFCEATGRRIGAWKRDGGPSPDLKQVIGALLARPGVELEDWIAGVRAMAAAPPEWVRGPITQIGHVFGEKAADWTLSAVARSEQQPQLRAISGGRIHDAVQANLDALEEMERRLGG